MALTEMIVTEFEFLTSRGFQPTIESPNAVLFESDVGVFVRVFRDPNDKYVGFRVGLMSRPRDALTATELARLGGTPVPRGEFPERTDELHSSVAAVARQLKANGDRVLSGDESIYDEAMQLRQAYTRRYTRPSE
jgi:hypothetical protein